MKQTRLIYSRLGLFFQCELHIYRSLWIGIFGLITLTVCSKELYLAVYEPLSLNMYIAFLFAGLFFYLNSLSVTYDKALSAMIVVSAVGMLASLYQSYIAIIENGQYLNSSMALIIYTSVTCFVGLLHKRRVKKCYSAI